MTLTDYMCQEKEKEDLPALKTMLTHRYNNSKTDYNHQRQYWQYKYQHSRNNQTTKMGRKTSDISHKKMWIWLRKGNWISSNSSQNNTIRTNHIKARTDKMQQNNRCRLCGDRDKMINHISKCNKLVQKEYKIRHKCVGKVIHWKLCKKSKFDHTKKWQMHNP